MSVEPSFKTVGSQKIAVDSRSKAYIICSLLSGGNDGVVANEPV